MMQSDPRFLCVSFHCPTRSTLAERLCQPACCWSPASVLAGAVTLHVESCTLTSFFLHFFFENHAFCKRNQVALSTLSISPIIFRIQEPYALSFFALLSEHTQTL